MKTKLAFWNESHTVSEYYRQAFLYNSELPLLSHIRERLPEVKMLDIGVGTGRNRTLLCTIDFVLCGDRLLRRNGRFL